LLSSCAEDAGRMWYFGVIFKFWKSLIYDLMNLRRCSGRIPIKKYTYPYKDGGDSCTGEVMKAVAP
jgi:hypothetical protein